MDIFDVISQLAPKRKQTPNGWWSFNAVCCQHNGESPDTKRRGGIRKTDDGGTTYHCFNCGFKTSWRPGRPLSKKMQKLMSWLGATDNQIRDIAFECLKLEAGIISDKPIVLNFEPKDLPPNSKIINEELILNEPSVHPIVEYIYSRGLTLNDSEFYWSSDTLYKTRLIIPIKLHNQIIGYIARSTTNNKIRFLVERPADVVFNLDNQHWENKFVLVVEGPIDALLLKGVATMTNDISPGQAMQINRLDKQVIVVPDRDKPGSELIKKAIENNWAVSFPEWDDDIKDAGDAVLRYGRLATLISIIQNVETSALKIKLRTKI
jgi:hypothetical protein